MSSDYSIAIAPTAYGSLKGIKDKKTQREIGNVIDGLARQPERQGKALVRPLEGLRTIRALRSRYRIIYRVDMEEKRVSVLLVGERKPGQEDDVYVLARRLLKTLMGEEE